MTAPKARGARISASMVNILFLETIFTPSFFAFKQFVLQTVTAEDLAKRFPKKKAETPTIKAQDGDKGVEFDIPSFNTQK